MLEACTPTCRQRMTGQGCPYVRYSVDTFPWVIPVGKAAGSIHNMPQQSA